MQKIFSGGVGLALVLLGQGVSAQTPPEIDTTPQTLSQSRLLEAGVAEAQRAMPPGPVEMTWESVAEHFSEPAWFRDGKFGIMMHWGIYSVPEYGSEWYVRYMYGTTHSLAQWHTDRFGPPSKFGYKDFIPMFTASRWDPDAWAKLFRDSGAKYVVPSAEHHDGFSLWDSAINRYNAKTMGPKRDLIGELAAAVRRQQLKFGVSNHSNNHFDFIPELANSDQRDPQWAEFYSVADRSDAARERFLVQWVTKNLELVDKYRLDMLWFDMNGSDRSWDRQKLAVAAYYYNRAREWDKAVAISAKGEAMLSGMVRDYERQGRIRPRGIKPFAWQVDDPIGNKFSYVSSIQYKPAALLIRRLVDVVSMNGNYLLNISPRADGTIPEEQQQRLLEMGRWLKTNGEAIYGSRPWTRYGEGPYYSSPPDTSPEPGPDDPPSESYTADEIRFTTKGPILYAFLMDWPGERATIKSLAVGSADLAGRKIRHIELLGHRGKLRFTQDAAGMHVQLPNTRPGDYAYALKVTF